MDCGIDAGDENNAYPYLDVPEFNIKSRCGHRLSQSRRSCHGALSFQIRLQRASILYSDADVMSLIMLDFVKIQRAENKELFILR